MQRNESYNSSLRPCAPVALHFVRRSSQSLSIQFIDLERFQIDPIDGTHVDRQSLSHELIHVHVCFGSLEIVHYWDTTCRTESVPGCFAPKSVDGEMVATSELDVFVEGVNPEIGVLLLK